MFGNGLQSTLYAAKKIFFGTTIFHKIRRQIAFLKNFLETEMA